MHTKHTHRKKVLFLITKSNWGGAQRYVFDLATNLNPEKFEVAVALGGRGALFTELESKEIRTIPIPSLSRDISIIKEFCALYELWKIIRREKPDVLHINSSKAGGLGAVLGRLAHISNIVFTAHGWAFNEDRPSWQKILIALSHWITILLSHTTIAVSHAIKSQISLPLAQNKITVIHNGRKHTHLHTREDARTFFTRHIPILRACENDFWSVTIGELHPTKQHDVTIRAFTEIIKTHPRTRHLIIGAGTKEMPLRELVQKLSLQDNIFFTGHIHEASQYLKAFDTFILPSRSEAFAYVLLEAGAAGLPIIASNVGGIPEIVADEESGLLFPSGDVVALAKQIKRISENPKLRESLGQEAKKRADEFTLEKMIAQTTRIYERIYEEDYPP